MIWRKIAWLSRHMSWAHHDFNHANKPYLTYIAATRHKQIRCSGGFKIKIISIPLHSQWLTLQFYVQLYLKEQSLTKWVCTKFPSFQISQTHLNLRWRSFVTTKFSVARMHNNFKLNELKLLTNLQSKTKSKLIKSLLSLGKHETTTNVRSLLTEPCFFNFCALATVTAPPIFHFVFNMWRDWRFVFKRLSPLCILFQIA